MKAGYNLVPLPLKINGHLENLLRLLTPAGNRQV